MSIYPPTTPVGAVECKIDCAKRRVLGNKAFLKASNWRNEIMIVQSLGDAEA